MEQLLELLLTELRQDAVVFTDDDGHHNVRVDGDVDLGAIAAIVLAHSARVVEASMRLGKPGGGPAWPTDIAAELRRQAAEARA